MTSSTIAHQTRSLALHILAWRDASYPPRIDTQVPQQLW
jgi:hypothetical protein